MVEEIVVEAAGVVGGLGAVALVGVAGAAEAVGVAVLEVKAVVVAARGAHRQAQQVAT